MNPGLRVRVESISLRFLELEGQLGDPDVISDQKLFRKLSKEYADLDEISRCYNQIITKEKEIDEANALKDDPDFKELALEEMLRCDRELAELNQRLNILLLPKDENDCRDVFLEIRAGTGGDESALFAGDMFRMYAKFCERQGWHLEIVSHSEGEMGGFKEIISKINGVDVYAALKFESGVHRVQRIPETEAQGRIHTSACTVAVLPVADAVEDIRLDPATLRIDTYRASGAGGQHINKTESAVRITHLPTGLVAECQEDRSQHKNKAQALSVLAARLREQQAREREQTVADTRRSLVGRGDRSERIRTYNFPQGRITDHRVNLTLYKLSDVMNGDLDEIINRLKTEYQAELLTEDMI